jgi:eukaryotic-like serine/threonine-protein kinase
MPAWRSSLYSVGRFLRNTYFWYGLVGLIVLGAGIYIGFDRALMPRVTRHGVSVTVPDVSNLTPPEADSILSRVGLSMRQQLLRKLGLPINQVIDQRPPAGSAVKPGRSVFVTINTGDTTTVIVPSVVGRSKLDVPGLLAEMGLTAGELMEDSVRSSFERDVVSRQYPLAGERRPRRFPILLWYSTGPSAEFVLVPDVSGLPVEEARLRLASIGLRSVVLGPVDAPVRDQGPTAGTTVREGSEVRLRTRNGGN